MRLCKKGLHDLGYTNRCHECRKISKKTYRLAHLEQEKLSETKYRKNNPDKARAFSKTYRMKNPAKYATYAANYRAAKLNATPKWTDMSAIAKIYQDCNDIECLSEELLEVDHIVPLQGKNVCGLHIAENLQIITRSENRSKGNK